MPTPRLFIVEFDLAELSGHFFNQALGFKLAAHELGLVPCVLLRKDVGALLADPLAGHRVIESDPIAVEPRDHKLDWLADGDGQLQSLWATMEEMAISRHDIILITSGRPIVIYSLGAWLGRLDRETRPAVFFRFYNHDYVSLTTMEFGEHSWMLRFAARDLWLRPGQERVFFTVNNNNLVAPLGRLCMRRVFQMPLPKFYGEMSNSADANADGPPVIYAHMNIRSGVMLSQIDSVIRTVLERYPRARFMLKYCRNALEPRTDAELSADLIERGVELIPTEQWHSDHLRTIARSDIVFLPYEVTEYAGLASGVFAEGAALGKVMVYPSNSWMDDQVADGHAAGVSFAVTNPTEISAAVLRALDSLPALLKEARERSDAFRKQHSCRKNLDLMLSLAGEKHNMRPTYVLGSAIRFESAVHSRGYMGRGWSNTEPTGVWTVGPAAELSFRVEPRPAGSLRVRVCLTPFFVKGHPQGIAISVNGVDLCEWSFADDVARRSAWHDFTIPSQIAASDELKMLLHVRNPLAPKQAGVSDDGRALGVMFHEMLLDHIQTFE
jgi:hypothetical protein